MIRPVFGLRNSNDLIPLFMSALLRRDDNSKALKFNEFDGYWSSQVFSNRQLLKMLFVCVVTFLTRG